MGICKGLIGYLQPIMSTEENTKSNQVHTPLSPSPSPSPSPLPQTKSTKPCLFFLKGTCVFGDKCNLAHGEVNKHRIPVCKYFLRGNCTYGDQCLYRHEQQPKHGGGPTPNRHHHHHHATPLNKWRT